MTTTNTIQNTVMQRIRTVYVLRSWLSVSSVAIIALVFALWAIGREVWVARVFKNMPPLTNVPALLHFYLAAFMNTREIVQVLSALVIVSAVWIIFVSARSITKILQPYDRMTPTF